MKNYTTKYIVHGVFTLIILSSCISKKSKNKQKVDVINQLNFINKSKIPLIKNCENNQTVKCLQNTISDLILIEVNNKKITLKNDTLRVGIRINKDGTTSILENKTSNIELKKVVSDILISLDTIEPAYFENQKSYKAVAYYWYIFIENNEIIEIF